jgi:GTP cyclohydrolase I
MAVDIEELRRIGRQLLHAIGEDPDREGLADTPDRFARWWREFIDHDPGTIERIFSVGNADEVVAVSGIEVWSLCEHHLLPFRARVAIGYIPADGVLRLEGCRCRR